MTKDRVRSVLDYSLQLYQFVSRPVEEEDGEKLRFDRFPCSGVF